MVVGENKEVSMRDKGRDCEDVNAYCCGICYKQSTRDYDWNSIDF